MPADQTQFRTALLDPTLPVPVGLTDGAGQPTTKRFAVYRNNVTVALTEALKTAFPVLVSLLGRDSFDQLARLFVRTHPPTSPLMMHYGAHMPAFLSDFPPLSHIKYLSDVARLELALRQSYHAADMDPFDASRLGRLDADRIMASTLTLAPATILIPSVWPLFDIWRYNTQSGAPKPRAMAQPVLITRAEFDPEPHPLTPAQAAWLTKIMDGATLVAAQDSAMAVDPGFDLSALLTLLIQNNAIANFTTPKD
ncbi:DNA-binding domain-containing protein [uncultured Tateyamaria sp.]|uniref:HvfC/BufC N-terminal domain-containing protein n=1 Tax=uncultured Tateyamaria sp. TaxID=455651 RepID=UPI0026372DDC|nr:DNA-binding domain-containing protein [uncultured Tateyamaria sp.]